jgi:alpha-glucuronidase
MAMKRLLLCLAAFVLSLSFGKVSAEDGSRLWLRMQANDKPADVRLSLWYDGCGTVEPSPTIEIALDELRNYWHGEPVIMEADVGPLHWKRGDDGFTLSRTDDGSLLLKAHGHDVGLLYGAFHLLRLQETGQSVAPIEQHPFFRLRMLNHWDNPDGSIERGYAGNSIFWNDDLTFDADLITQYARANASIGINATVLNNVNASPKMLTRPYLNKVKEIADLLRPWGISVVLSVNFGTPKALGELTTADPLNKKVQRWWQQKAKEIYQLIPDFGGFLVKANSEGQPGPFDYGRTHADGANMLADALKPYGGIVMWRSFVYGAKHKGEDRVKQAVSEFAELDGQFRENVILQSKNGPLDFQPREPYAPIFDQMKQTTQMAELQITQEYLGHSKHLVFLAPMWKEFFSFVPPSRLIGIAGVANVGLDRNWCGHHFAQANWYAFGRLAWNPAISSKEIAEEWLTQTFFASKANKFLYETSGKAERERGKENSKRSVLDSQLTGMMLRSREACVDYMMPLGLHHIFKFDHHYGPEPDGFKAHYPLEWCPVYYHKATTDSIGFNRSTTGSGATQQYREPLCSLYDNVNTCPEEYLLWFHRVPWTRRLNSGRTVYEEMQWRYNRGVGEVEDYIRIWEEARGEIDDQRWEEVNQRLHIQLDNAKEWRDTCLGYFGKFAQD